MREGAGVNRYLLAETEPCKRVLEISYKFKRLEPNRKQASKNWVDMFDFNHWTRNIIGTKATNYNK